MSDVPKLSVVIIGRNEGERLVRCLESVRSMNDIGGPVEILYVDSESTDGSVARARALGARVLEVQPERPAAAIGRNAGWRAARAPIVLFLDSDTILDPAFVADSLRHFEDPQVAIVWGHRREIDTRSSLYNRVLDLDWIYPPGDSEFCGGDALVRRDVLEEVGGYDDTLIAGEEPEMCRRIRTRGYRILHVDHPMTGHDLAMTRFGQYWKRAFRAGHAYAEVSDRFRGTGTPLWEDDVRRNAQRGVVLLAAPFVAVAASIVSLSPWPFVAFSALFGLLVLRTALKAGWKSGDPMTRLLYGLHSHAQQIPIFFGQLSYRRDRKRGRRRMLIDYKQGDRPMSSAKTLTTALLRPFARLASGPGRSLRRAWAHARLAASIEGSLDPGVVVQGVPEIHGTGRIRLGKSLFLYRDLYLETAENGEIIVGDGVVMSRGVHVVSFSRVTIGAGAMIGEYVSIRDANHRIDNDLPIRESGHETAPITIGPDAWIGRGVTVLAGVTVGAGAIVGANAVVTKDVPPYTIAVGIPARVVKERSAHYEAVPS